MKVTYDRGADAMLIELAEAEVAETRDIARGVYADYDSDGRVIAFEILKASRKYDLVESEIEPPDPYMSVSEAGEMFGISPTTLRRQIAKGVLKGSKSGRVRHDHVATYVRERRGESESPDSRSQA